MALYDTFSAGIISKEFTIYKKDEFMKMVKALDAEGIKTFLLLVKLHDIKVNPLATSLIPYDGTGDGNNVSFELEKIPILLQNILYKFMEMYIKNKTVELERQSFAKAI